MKRKLTRKQLLKEAAACRMEALVLMDTLPGMKGLYGVRRARSIQRLFDKALRLKFKAGEAGR